MKGFTVDDLKYFTYEYEKACNLGKMYLLSKIHKRYSDSRETDHLFQPVECLLKRYPNFWIITLNQTCKMIYIRDSGNSRYVGYLGKPQAQKTKRNPL